MALRAAGHDILIVAPSSERSATSHAISIRKDIRVENIAPGEYAVDGTPADCIIVAVQKIITEPIDLVISGVNAGQNMGEDIHYSGTVGAAAEASFFGYKAIAASICSYSDQIYETSATWIVKLLEMGIQHLIQPLEVLNINFPNIPHDKIKGIRLTRTGHRKYYNFIKVISEDATGFYYQIGGDKPVWDMGIGTDAEAVREDYISITPLGFEMTRGEAFPGILEWLETNSLLQI